MRGANPSILGSEAGLVTGLPPLSDGTAAPPHGTARAQRTPAIAGSFIAAKRDTAVCARESLALSKRKVALLRQFALEEAPVAKGLSSASTRGRSESNIDSVNFDACTRPVSTITGVNLGRLSPRARRSDYLAGARRGMQKARGIAATLISAAGSSRNAIR